MKKGHIEDDETLEYKIDIYPFTGNRVTVMFVFPLFIFHCSINIIATRQQLEV